MSFGSDMPPIAPDVEARPISAEAALADLTASRLAHEIVGPVGAISNGLELMEELGEDAGDDAVKLVADSARQAAARLQFYRVAYGRSGYGVTNMAQLRAAATSFFEEAPHHELSWPLPPVLPSLDDGTGRVILIMTELARDCLVRGGVIKVSTLDDAIDVVAEGRDSQLDDSLAQALDGRADAASLTPRNVHAALARVFAGEIGYGVTIKAETESVTLSLVRTSG